MDLKKKGKSDVTALPHEDTFIRKNKQLQSVAQLKQILKIKNM